LGGKQGLEDSTHGGGDHHFDDADPAAGRHAESDGVSQAGEE